MLQTSRITSHRPTILVIITVNGHWSTKPLSNHLLRHVVSEEHVPFGQRLNSFGTRDGTYLSRRLPVPSTGPVSQFCWKRRLSHNFLLVLDRLYYPPRRIGPWSDSTTDRIVHRLLTRYSPIHSPNSPPRLDWPPEGYPHSLSVVLALQTFLGFYLVVLRAGSLIDLRRDVFPFPEPLQSLPLTETPTDQEGTRSVRRTLLTIVGHLTWRGGVRDPHSPPVRP